MFLRVLKERKLNQMLINYETDYDYGIADATSVVSV
jgi:Mrp family chromosome partitioning ATPase